MNLREAIGRLTSESLVYGLGQAGGRLVQVALVPVLTRAFTPEAYGVVDLVMLVAAVVSLFAVSGMDAALARFFYEAPDRASRRAMAATSAAHRLATGSLLGALLLIFAAPVSTLVLGSADYAKYVRILGATLPFTALYLFANEALRVTFQPWKYIALNGLNMILVGGLTLWFVLGLRLSVAGVFYAKLAGDAAAAAAGLVLLRHTLAPRGSWADLKRMLRYGGPLVPAALTYAVLTYTDRQVLLRFASLEEVGIYAVAVKGAAVVMLAVTAFQLAWGPMAFATAGDPDHGRLYSRVLTLYVTAGSALALGVSFFAPEALGVFVPAAYRGAAAPAALLAFAGVAHGAYYIAALGVNLEQKNQWLIVTTGGAALVTVALALLLVRPWGGAGVAAATLCGFAFSTVSLYRVSQRLRPFPYRGLRSLAVFAAALLLAVGGWWLPVGGAGWFVKGALWVGFVAGAAWLAARSRVAPLAAAAGPPGGPASAGS
jgi:O-antigen/teichoic acid export membrane protein